jgi:acetylornithine deacetylase/succinyl-diaminopimelate desuccinylase-like protein
MVACLVCLAVADLAAQVSPVDQKRLRATVEKLALFQTRNTLSATMPESAEWVATEFRKIPGLEVEVMRYRIEKSARVPSDREVVQVVAKLPGRTAREVIVSGHLDSLQAGADPLTARAPGANDDATGVAVALEMARAMAGRKWENTLVFAALTGEEQGLLGAKALATRCREESAQVVAVLNNDTVGSTRGHPLRADRTRVRVFSDEFVGGDVPAHNSRELGRYVEFAARGLRGFGVKLVLRKDRFGRGGDHTPFVQEGYSAVRFTEAFEDYARQHTPNDLPERIDWGYLANVARVNLRALAALADSGPAPTEVKIDLKQGYDTTIKWQTTPGVRYTVYWRDTASAVWQGSAEVGAVAEFTVKGVNKDDNVFAVGSVGGIPVVAK